jgi:hypothetical protein
MLLQQAQTLRKQSHNRRECGQAGAESAPLPRHPRNRTAWPGAQSSRRQVCKSLTSRIIELIGVTSLIVLDLGLIGNESLKYLSKILENKHNLEELSFG